jgi:hypothetical protein
MVWLAFDGTLAALSSFDGLVDIARVREGSAQIIPIRTVIHFDGLYLV